MYCKNCGRKLNQSEKFCPSCGNEIKVTDRIKKTFKSMVISLIIFLIVLLVTILAMSEFYKDNSGAGGWIIVILIFLTFGPSIAAIVFSSEASSLLKKYKKEGLDIPKKVKILGIINKLQIPLIIFVFVIGFVLKDKKYEEFINQKLNELYNSNYEIVNTCKRSNEGGDNYKILVIKLENFEYPIISRFDWQQNNYEDNYDELKQADQLNYHSYINSIFGDVVIALMDFDNDEKYNYNQRKQINLSILLTSDYLNNQSELKLKVKQIINKYALQFSNYDFSFNIYFTNEIDAGILYIYE